MRCLLFLRFAICDSLLYCTVLNVNESPVRLLLVDSDDSTWNGVEFGHDHGIEQFHTSLSMLPQKKAFIEKGSTLYNIMIPC